MKKCRFSLLAASAVCAAAATAMVFSPIAAADDYREVTLSGTNVFYVGAGGASLSAVRVDDESEQGHTDYTSFVIGEDETVEFRKNLAYSWYAADEDGNGVNSRFSMQIGFESIAFESYVIHFQSQQYAVTEDGVSDNYLIFKPDGGKLNLFISESDALAEDEQPSVVLEDYSSVTFAFGDYAGGDYDILVNGAEEPAGQFVNVRENYASYVSSGDSAATPITFSATFAEDAADDASCEMIMYSLNNQSFAVYGAELNDEGVLTGGVIHDDRAPVVCLNEGINYLTFGAEIDIDYTVIDVVASSPRTTVQYYILTTEQFNSTELDYNNVEEEELFTEVSTSDDFKLLRDQYTYINSATIDPSSGIMEFDGYKTYGLVKLCLYVKDTSSSSAQTDYVFLDWYVPSEYVYDIAEDKNQESAANTKFIRVAEDLQGAGYNDGTVTDYDSYVAYIDSVEKDYQAKIDEYVESEGGIFASSKDNVFLPDFSGYITDNLGGYQDLTYSIYYTASSTGSETSLDYNELAFTASEANVTYRFTIYATDKAGNKMRYPDPDNAGEWLTIETEDIWESDYADLLPFFTIRVSYKAATVETPEVQSIGYVGSTYSSASFDITGVSDTYSAEYKLYIFDRDKFYSDTGIELSYQDVIDSLNDSENSLFFNGYEGVENSRRYFTLVEEDDETYEWNSSRITFVPNSPNEYYVVRLILTDTGLSNKVTNSFLVVRASARAAEIYGEDNWLENNLASIVLFSVAGVCLIAFIALLFIKPKDKGDIDEIAVQVEEKAQAKADKKKN